MKTTTALSFLLFALACPFTAAAQPIGSQAEASDSKPIASFCIAGDESAEGRLEETVGKTSDKIYLLQEIDVTDDDIVSATVVIDANGQPAIGISFSEAGARNMSAMTADNLGKRLAVFVNGKVISAPRIRSRISTNAVITGNFSQEEAQRIAATIAPPPFGAYLLLVKSNWVEAKDVSVKVELRDALRGASVPAGLLDKLPASGPEILFPAKILSLYTPEHYAELLACLKANDLIVSIDAFPAAQPMSSRSYNYPRPVRVSTSTRLPDSGDGRCLTSCQPIQRSVQKATRPKFE